MISVANVPLVAAAIIWRQQAANTMAKTLNYRMSTHKSWTDTIISCLLRAERSFNYLPSL